MAWWKAWDWTAQAMIQCDDGPLALVFPHFPGRWTLRLLKMEWGPGDKHS